MRRVLFAILALAPVVYAQTGNPLKDFADKIAVSSVNSPLADPAMQEELSRLDDWIPTAATGVIADALPSVGSLLTKGNAGQRGAAIVLLFGVSRRQEAILLKPWLPAILACLRDPTPGTAGFAGYILLNLFPQPVEVVVPYLIDYVRDEQVGEELRASAIGTLVWYAPDDAAVTSAISDFMKAKHSKEARAVALQGMGLMISNSHRYTPELVDLIVSSVKTDPGTRATSIEALGRLGWRAFPAAVRVLTEISGDEHETGEIRDAARMAIESILRSPRN